MRKVLLHRLLLTIVALLSVPLGARANPSHVVVIRIENPIMPGGTDARQFRRLLQSAADASADLVILDLECPGGNLQAVLEMQDALLKAETRTLAFVNSRAISAASLLAISCDKIVMTPTGSIGGGTSIGTPPDVELAIRRMLRPKIDMAARANGFPIQVCEAFFDPSITIPGVLSSPTDVLLLNAKSATQLAFPVASGDNAATVTLAAYVAGSVEGIIRREGLWPADLISREAIKPESAVPRHPTVWIAIGILSGLLALLAAWAIKNLLSPSRASHE